MTRSRITLSFLLLCALFSTSGASTVRTALWKPERILGSARLPLEDIRAVYLPPEPSARLEAAVEDLVSCWPASLEQRKAWHEASKGALVLIRDEGLEGFSYRRDRTRVYLRASTDEGLADGLYAICRELLGARWYWAGELGFERVGEVADTFPDRIWRDQPAFAQRTLYPVDTDFGRRNGLNRKFSFNHNLARIFTAEVYASAPEVFPEIGGERRPPQRSAKYDPQPDFTNARTVELAARAASQHFDEHPGSNSFSLSINDNSLFDEGAKTEAVVRGQSSVADGPLSGASGQRSEAGEIEYFRGRPNYTDLVFGFMNEVAERLERAEDRDLKPEENGCWSLVSALKSQPSAPYLTALAYYWTEQSPSFEVHPKVMPVLTSDRAQWHDPKYRAEDKALIKRWADSGAERIATWDYYFGAPYPYPRQFSQWIIESIRYLHESGVDVFFSQLPSVWGLDGPKAWLAAELLRDPQQDADALLDEFYANFFGQAAEPIRQFYEMAEQIRNQREGTASWIKFYKDEAGIELFTPESLSRLRECITRAEQCAAHDPRRLARVRIVSEAFSYTESYAAYHQSRVHFVELAMAALRGDSEGMAEGVLARALLDYQNAKASFNELKEILVENPLHRGFSTFNRLTQSDPTALVVAGLEDVSGPPSLLSASYARRFNLVGAGKNPRLEHSGTELRNFLGPEVPVIPGWEIQYRASENLGVDAASGQESSGLRVENADIVSLAQSFPVISEQTYLLQIDASWQVSPDNRTRVQLNWKSVSGERLGTDILLRLPNGSSTGVQPLPFALKAPTNAYELKVGVITNRQYEGDYLEINSIEFGRLVPPTKPR